jgi:hypothetical protein
MLRHVSAFTLGQPMIKSFSANIASGGVLPALLRTDPNAPVPVRRAAQAMYVGAGVSVISLLISVIGSFSLKSGLISANKQNLADGKVTMSQINSVATAGIVYAIVIGIIAVALWIWMAKMSGAGRGWARISSTVFFALWSIYTYINVNSLHSGVTVTVAFLISFGLMMALWVVGAVAIYQLWRPVSTAYYRAQAGSTR